MKVKINAGAEFETATPQDVKDAIGKGNQNWFREMARGVKQVRFSTNTAADAAGGILLGGPNQQDQTGPRSGFMWAVRRVSILGLTGTETVQIHRNSTDGAGFIATLTLTGNVFMPDSHALVLNASEQLIFVGSGLVVGEEILINGEATEVPEFMGWKLLH